MKPCTRRKVTINPLASPITIATATVTTIAGPMFPDWPAMIPPPTTLERLTTKGTDRSREPPRTTSVWPIAMKPRMLVVVRMLSTLPTLKKLRPLTAVRIAPATMATSRTPYTIVVDVTVLRRCFTAPPLALCCRCR